MDLAAFRYGCPSRYRGNGCSLCLPKSRRDACLRPRFSYGDAAVSCGGTEEKESSPEYSLSVPACGRDSRRCCGNGGGGRSSCQYQSGVWHACLARCAERKSAGESRSFDGFHYHHPNPLPWSGCPLRKAGTGKGCFDDHGADPGALQRSGGAGGRRWQYSVLRHAPVRNKPQYCSVYCIYEGHAAHLLSQDPGKGFGKIGRNRCGNGKTVRYGSRSDLQ